MSLVKIERKVDWSIRAALSDDSRGIMYFYGQNIWKNKEADALYNWKFGRNPFGDTLSWIGVNSMSNIIATCIYMPWVFTLGEKIIKANQLVDGVVQLEYRGQGLALTLLNQGMADSFNKGASFSFAFPNENGAAVHRQNKGYHLGHILRYTKPLRSGYFLERYIKSKFLLKLVSSIVDAVIKFFSKETYYINPWSLGIEKGENCGKEFDDFFERFSGAFQNKIVTKKGSRYLNWKYVNSPSEDRALYAVRKDSIVYGFVVLESTPKIGYIVDLIASDKQALAYLIAYSIKYFRNLGKDSVVFVALENNMYFGDLKKFGFIERPEEKHFYIYIDEKMKDKEYFMDSQNWFITIGDCDIEALG